jgi:hypothetical protein
MGVRVMTYSDTLLQTGEGFIRSKKMIDFILTARVAWIAYIRGSLAIQNDLGGKN